MPGELIFRALQHVWSTLERLNIPLAVMGGIAVAAWKHVRATHDVDLLIGIGEAGPDLLLQRLAEAGVRPKRQPPILSLGQLQILQLLYEPPGAHLDVQVDLLLADSPYHREALARRIPAQLPDLDIEVSILSCEDLILLKLLARRIIDRADAAALLRANRPSLDLRYLSRWTSEPELTADLAEIWGEAFPGEKPSLL
jgi:hypothetical protein